MERKISDNIPSDMRQRSKLNGNVRQISNESSDSTSSQRRMSSSSSCESSGDKVRICGRRVSATELFTNVILQPADVFEHHRLSLIEESRTAPITNDRHRRMSMSSASAARVQTKTVKGRLQKLFLQKSDRPK